MSDDDSAPPVVVPAGTKLSPEQEARIKELQDEIEEIWNKKGDYVVDEDAWKEMPMFMPEITEKDVETNDAVAALSHLAYEETDPTDVAAQRKEHGNKMMQYALTPGQENHTNFARSAVRSYTEGLEARCPNANINAVLYANRSMAQFILENFGYALEDAQRALKCDPNYAKAYFRGAKAAMRVYKYTIARKFCEKSQNVQPPPTDTQQEEIAALLTQIQQLEDKLNKKVKVDSRRVRQAAAESSQLTRKMHAKGITVGERPEISTEQWEQVGCKKPFFDDEDVLHVPMLLLYDEFSQSDTLHDVPTDCTVADLVNNILPVPWDNEGRYDSVPKVLAVYKIDDGVAMPQWYEAKLNWQLLEVFRSSTYVMPGIVPTLHIVARDSPLVKEWGITPERVALE